MRIDIWSDVICPFCYIGRVNLETALTEAGLKATVVHHAFRLMPGEAPYPVEEMFVRRYGQSAEQAKASIQGTEAVAAKAGLSFRLAGTLCGDTIDAHTLLAFAGERSSDLMQRMYHAYFTLGRNLFDRQVLTDLAAEVGLDPTLSAGAFDFPSLKARVEADQKQAQGFNVRGVPFFVFDNHTAVSGAQPVSAFLKAFKAIAENHAQP
ncbi:DsbA family oxidoreductase [Asticcacaulis sp. AC402]|uniref:DsbA family oxidoreductase n=1 Tax=Asticcacaulis sp. AC402 TaxID=1282361 RepID=UPI0004083243|nr:DsbA family oxidoreductase [Asticcacaulis sp. AC402]